MGLSRHVLDMIEKTGRSLRQDAVEEEDSSEVERTRREKRESAFYDVISVTKFGEILPLW